MAYIVSVTTSTKNGASVSPDEGTHAVGDLLAVFASNDNGGTELATSSTGWSKLGTTAASAGVRSAWFWKIATGTTGETPTITGAADDWTFSFYVIRNAHATQPFGASPAVDVDWKRYDYDLTSVKGSINIAASALTTGAANALLLVGICIDTGASTLGIKPNPDDFVQDGAIIINSGGVSHITGHLQFGAAAATPALTAYSNVQEGGNAWLIAVRDDGTGDYLQKDCRTGGEVIKWHGDFGNTFETLTYSSPKTNFDTTTNKIDGLDASTTAPTVSTLTDALGAPGGLSSFADATNGGADVWAGTSYAITATDMTGQVVSCRWQMSSTSSPLGTKGLILLFGSGADMTTNWVAYQLLANPATTAGISASNNYMSAVALGAATAFASHGTIDWADVTRRGFFYHRVAGSATSRTIYLRNEIRHAAARVIGGNATVPAQVSYVPDTTRGNGVPFVNTKQGTGQALTKGAIQIGDGSTPTYFKLESQSFEFPQSWLISDIDRLEWNANAGSVGVTVYAADGDTMDFSAGTIASSTKQPFTINASSSIDGSTTYNFSGMGLVGFDPTWKTGVACNGITFANCDTVKLKGADATGITVKSCHADVGATDAAVSWDANGATLTSSTIDVTGTSSGYHIALDASVTSFEINGTTLTGTPASGFKFYSALTSGELTITTDGTGTALVAGDVEFAAGTAFATIAAPQVYQKVTVSGITTGARVQIYDTTSSTELFNGTATAGDTVVSGSTVVWTDPAAASADRAIRIRVSYVSGTTAKNFIETSGLTCGQTGATAEITYPVTPTDDTTYNTNAVNGSSVTGITFTDAATDLVSINIAANTVPLKNVYAAFVYWLFTAAGIDDDVAYIDAPDTANYIMTSMKFRNTSTSPLKITGGYFYDSTGSVENCVDTAGSSGNIFPMPEHVVPYQTTGTYAITGDLQDALDAIAGVPADVWADSKALTVPKFLGLK